MSGRVQKSMRNITLGITLQMATIILGFVSRTVFLYYFTKDYVGISSLFSSIFTVLSLADLGMETSMTVRLYKPLLDDDKLLINAFLNYYRKVFYIIAAAIAVVGVTLIPFLGYLVDIPKSIEYVSLIYFLTLANTVISYLFIYKKIILISDQKKYKTDAILLVKTIMQYAIVIPLLIVFKSYILFLFIQIVFTVISNFAISLCANREYSYLKKKPTVLLSSDMKRNVKDDMGAISLHRIGDVVSANAATLLTASFVNITAVAVYSNYLVLINYVKAMMDKVYYSVSPSVGNLIAEKNSEKTYHVFNRMFFLSFWIAGVCASCLMSLINPFIKLWIGEDYLLGISAVVLIIVNFVFVNLRKPVLIFKEAFGFFKIDKFRPIVESILIFIIATGLAKGLNMGLNGILIASILVPLISSFWIEPLILFKVGLNRSSIWYFIKYLFYIAVIIIAVILTYCLCGQLNDGILNFLLRIAICIVIPNLIFVLATFWTEEYKWMIVLLGGFFHKFIKRRSAKE